MKPVSLGALWQSVATKDRRALVMAAAVLSALALWQWGLAPAWRTTQDTPKQLTLARAELQRMQTLARQAQSLQTGGAAPAASRADTLAAIERITQQTMGPSAQVLPQGDRVQIKLTLAAGQDMAAWLAQLRSQARVATQEVQIQVASAAGTVPRWSGTVLLVGVGLQQP
jgi:general secretion pathway protein M